MDQEPTIRKVATDSEREAAIWALTNSRELHRVLIGLLRTGAIKAVYEGPHDSESARLEVDRYKFFAPDSPSATALSPETLRSYGCYNDGMMRASLRMLRDAVKRLCQAHAHVQWPMHESDVADWSATADRARGVDEAFNHAFDIFADEVLPNLMALLTFTRLQRDQVASLEHALGVVKPTPPSEP